MDHPSYRVRPGQVIAVDPRSRAKPPFQIAAGAHAAGHPPYLRVDQQALTARLDRLPTRPEISAQCDEQLVVEFYTR